MTEATSLGADPGGAATMAGQAGAMIRAARQARGQTLQHLSILLKISERRLQAFEEERWPDVGDRTFVRALAQRLCRHLELDSQTVLLLLPAPLVEPMRPIDRGLPLGGAGLQPRFRRPWASVPDRSGAWAWLTPVRAGVVVILVAAGLLALLPAQTWRPTPSPAPLVLPPGVTPAEPVPAGPADAPAEATANAPVSALSTAAPADGPTSGPTAMVAPVVPAASTENPTAALQLTARQDSWVQVTDVKGTVLLSRLLRSGERVGVEGARPLRLRVGNTAGTEASWLGRRIALDEVQRNNVAEIDLP